MTDTPSQAPAQVPNIASVSLSWSEGLPDLLDLLDISFAFSTYQAGKLFVVGRDAVGQIAGTELGFARSMGIGLSANARQLFLATKHQIYRFDNFLRPGEVRDDGMDAVYVPRVSWVTGDLDAHDIAPGPGGRPIFVNTAFNCIATVSAGYSFRPLWRPPFITAMTHEDRCHLNGMAVADGVVNYVTLVAQTDEKAGWRQARDSGGLVMDPRTNRIVCSGLSMPHSPRLYRDRLWVLNSGHGTFGWVDTQEGIFHPVAFCPGYARGLTFAGDYAFIGLSGPRDDRLFGGLPLEKALSDRGVTATCGVIAVHLGTGVVAASLTLRDPIRELYDVQVLPGMRRPTAIGFRTEEVRRMIAIDG